MEKTVVIQVLFIAKLIFLLFYSDKYFDLPLKEN